MLKAPAVPSKKLSQSRKSHRSNPHKKGGNDVKTAPNTPEEVGAVTVMANEYDPSQDLDALVRGDVPSSPLRVSKKRTSDIRPSMLCSSMTAEEEKKEADDDVVAKTLAFIDDICAVPAKSDGSSSIVARPKAKKTAKSKPPVKLEKESSFDDTSGPSGSSLSQEVHSNSADSSKNDVVTKKAGSAGKKVIPKSPSQDHENFEVVLDPTSLVNEDNSSKRRWPFASALSNKDDEDPTIKELDLLERKTRSEPIVPPKRMVSEQLPKPEPAAVNRKIVEKEPTKDTNKKSLVKRSWKSCKKLIGKSNAKQDQKQQLHPAEVDNETKVVQSLEELTFLQEGSPHRAVEPIAEESEEDLEDAHENDETKTEEAPASSIWNSIVASIAGTFDPEIAATNAVVSQDTAVPPDASKKSNEGSRSLEVAEADSPPTKVNVAPAVDHVGTPAHGKKGKGAPAKGWRPLKAFKKKGAKGSAKSKKPVRKKQEKQTKASATPTKIAPPKSAPTKSAPTKSAPQEAAGPVQKPKAVWKATKDPHTGKTYYYHRKTRETTWIKPKEYSLYEKEMQKWRAATEIQDQATNSSFSNTIPSKENEPAGQKEKPREEEEDLSSDHASTRVSTWPKERESADLSDATQMRRTATPPPKGANPRAVALPMSPPPEKKEKKAISQAETKTDQKADANWEKRNEVERLLQSLPPDETRPSLDQYMKDYAGREDVLLAHLRAKVESHPFDEPLDSKGKAVARPSRSPHRFGQRSMTYMSKASATTRSSALTDRTEKIKNTGKGKASTFGPVSETMSNATSISSRREDDQYFSGIAASPRRVPSKVPVPRERQLMVEELTDSRVSAESYEGNGGRRGRIVRGRPREPVEKPHHDVIYDGDNDTDTDNATSAYDNDTYGTDSVSALSENDTDFLNRKDNFEQARRRALDDAIEREDWDLAAALSEGMRAANLPGGYAKAHSSWNQSELDKFIANNDWNAVKSYIARMREISKTKQVTQGNRSSSANKNIGARSQLQHKELMSESSWTSDSQSSYESSDSESDI
eukprot:CAMPEP_0178747088 /NCGR_PEP_ID=MMETSP0744-20121128/8139_1 /TAXON_ID=913974 /ORGANISM="Nitzschia punctata, Strain CCMP561" /LENGTH=1039 /DNA_ID=CAMNT_0020400309 /DNA_START=496 /DNA_END=3616 /DNA_ORIENTATION=+